MLCPNCKKEIDNDSTFCEFCGQDLRKKPSSNAGLVIGIMLGALVLIGGGIFGVMYLINSNADESASDFPNEKKVISTIKRFTNAVDRDDFETISDCYAQEVERYHNDRNTDNNRVVKGYKNYNEKFGVYNKRTSIREGSFEITPLNDSIVSVIYVEDFHIDRYDSNKWTDFVLRKHVKLDKDYKIISIYDDQLEKYK